LRSVDPTGQQAQTAAPEVDEKETIFREARKTLETVEKSNPQLAGAGGEAADAATNPR